MLASRLTCLVPLSLALLASSPARAHFTLQSPPASLEQSQYGDPQKAPPCGDDGGGKPTGAVTAYQAGDMITITIDETIYHPGHYRIAIAPNDISELPAEPIVTPDDKSDCGSAPIQSPAVYPVLADGVFLHDAPFGEPQSIDIPVPEGVSCTNCTLQIIQFMSNHGLNVPGGCYYHHCAIISLDGGPATSTTTQGEETGTASAEDTAGTTPETSQGETTDNNPTSNGPDTTAASNGDATSAGSASTGGDDPTTSPTAPNTSAETTPNATDATAGDDDAGGCACTSTQPTSLTPLLALLGLLGLRRRR